MLINNKLIYMEELYVNKSKATIIISHGMAEHSGRFKSFAKDLNNAKYDVILYDLRGHGQSQGERGNIKSYNDFVEDLDAIIDYVSGINNKEIFLFGHSMGGIVSNLAAIRNKNVTGVITSSSPLDYLKQTKFLRFYTYKIIGWKRLKTNFSDKKLATVGHNINDPLNLDSVKLSLVGEMLVAAIKKLTKQLKDYDKSLLVLHGAKDKLVPSEAIESNFTNIPSKDKRIIKYSKSKHDLLHDVEKEEVQRDIIKWLGEHT